ncbi:MAG: enoyl-CoA hydratase/isomerase family protein [Deltaproteobacteria bacterium]|nr:enoyl-CoA hydratase/isomerase family protein [Deltaproteobacteria bacterium]
MEYNTILYVKTDGIVTITLNRPKAYNALNFEMFKELDHVFSAIKWDDDVKVVIIAGSDNFFAAGADISEVSGIETPAAAYEFVRDIEAFHRIEELDRPVIAAIGGLALGGGCELSMCCDLRIAAENAIFGQPEIKIGVIPGGGGTQRLPRLIGVAKAKELLYTGDTIDAHEAYRLGLVNKVVPVEALMDEARTMAKKIARQPGIAVRATKLAVNGGMSMDMNSAIAYEARCFEILFSTEDQKEGTNAFMEKRKPVFKDR